MVKNDTVTLLGNFDGVHLGHRELIRAGLTLAEKEGLTLTAWTFDALFAPAITPTDERLALLKSYGVKEVVTESFDNVKDLSPKSFVCDILKGKLNTSYCVCGYNYTFGRGGKGDAELLKKLCNENGIGVIVVDKVELEGEEVSSSVIRAYLKSGRVDLAARLMGRRYYCTQTVKEGAGKGRTVGMPTLNLYLDDGACLPKNGVYATLTCLENGKSYPSVTNVGYRPTLNDGRGLSVETHIPDFNSDLYGQRVRVEFISYLREEKRFSSLSELSLQVKNDIVSSKEIFLKEASKGKE